ncbi:MAG TPA: Gfo/Idh/MocA family oxidoreductase [Pirellulales bacterium]|nr:Gfo/Idh/MocA family oxidoreductase [Pirellulales bacterium]
MNEDITRRAFLSETGKLAGGAAGGLAAVGLTASGLGLAQPRKASAARSANEKLVIGLVGCGYMGRANLRDFLRVPEVEVAAVCDVDSRRLAEALEDVQKAERNPGKVETCRDFRRLIDRKDIDALVVVSPDHWHAYMATAAMRAGKDVYCEKPLAHSIREGRAIVQAAEKYHRVVQIGTQQRSGTHFQKAVELVQSGVLGKIHCCRSWICENNAPQGLGNPPDGDPPKEVDYDQWLGPAPKRPFNPNRFHYNFRYFYDYGNGLINDWGTHLHDIILWGMQIPAPLSVQAAGGKLVLNDNTDTPDTLEAVFDFGEFIYVASVRRGNAQSLRYTLGGDGKLVNHGHGMQFEGTNGTLFVDRGGWELFPETEDGRERAPAQKSGGSDQHYPHVLNFLDCVKTRRQPISDVLSGHQATMISHLANIAYRTGRKIHWDADQEVCTHHDGKPDVEANAYLFREPRAPWKLEL